MKTVLIVGDSIAMGYAPLVAEALAGELAVRRNDGNAGDSAHLLEHLPDYLDAAGEADLVHLNCGLHDVKTPFGSERRQVPLEDYRTNLAEIVSRLVHRQRTVVWATTTPVLHARHHAVKGFDRFEADVREYNAAAAEIVAAAEIPTNDLYAVIQAAGAEACLGPDGVHMTDAGNAALAGAVASAVREHIERAP